MSNEAIEQHVIIAGTNASEVAKAVSVVIGKIGFPSQKHMHPNNPDCPETIGVWNIDRQSSILGVSRLYRPRIGPNGADFRHYDPTNEYRIRLYEGDSEVDKEVLERTLKIAQKENSFAGRLRNVIRGIRWVFTKAPVNFP